MTIFTVRLGVSRLVRPAEERRHLMITNSSKDRTSSKRILHVIHSVSLEGGGPAEGLRRLGEVDPMGMEVVCLDDPIRISLTDHPYPIYGMGDSTTTYYGYTPRLTRWINTNFSRFDGVVIHGLWQYHSYGTYRSLLGKLPYIVFPHGMLDSYFRQTYPLKHLYKSAYWLALERRVLRDAKAVCFTSQAEHDCSVGTFWLDSWKAAIVSFGTAAAKGNAETQRELFLNTFPSLRSKRILLFLSRIHRKKGCDILIEAFARIAADHPDLDLVIAGPDHDGLRNILFRQTENLGLQNRIHWTGMLREDEKWGAFRAADAFVLPSHQENFGVAVAEALACGIPTLISNKVNTWPDILACGAGLVDDDTVDGTHRNLVRFLSMCPAEGHLMSVRARDCFQKHFLIDHTAHAIGDLFSAALSDSVRTRNLAQSSTLSCSGDSPQPRLLS
jgi:glycosyltransferase involved in cell wall biosynthesis